MYIRVTKITSQSHILYCLSEKSYTIQQCTVKILFQIIGTIKIDLQILNYLIIY